MKCRKCNNNCDFWYSEQDDSLHAKYYCSRCEATYFTFIPHDQFLDEDEETF